MIWDMQIDRGSTTLSVWTRGRGAFVWPLASGPIPVPSIAITSITRSGNGVQLNGVGVPNAVHRIEVSDDLVTEAFSTFGHVTADGNGAIQYTDMNSGNLTKRFYRLAYP